MFEYIFENSQFIKLPGNNISSICPVHFLKNAILLDLQFNKLIGVKQRCFPTSTFLKSISLNNNHILYLHIYSFQNLNYLKYLNLSVNPFVNLPSKCFSGVLNLKILNLVGITFRNVEGDSFISSHVKVIETLDYKISCIVSEKSFCSSYPPWYISCSDILPGKLLKIIYVIISMFTVTLNILSILLQVSRKDSKEYAFKITVIGLNFTDILCGFYLTGIWVSDVFFQGVYLVNKDLWKSHPLCFAGFDIILSFTIANQIILIFLSTTRLLVVIFPMKRRRNSWKHTLYEVTTILLMSFLISFFLTIIFQFSEKHLPTSLCLPFIDPSGSSILTKIISWIIICSQSMSTIVIVVIHAILLSEVKKVKKSFEATQSYKYSSKKMMYQLILTSISNILCWFPANAVYIAAMFLSSYPIDLVIWTAVMIMPLNSIFNPIIFITANFK